MNDSTVASAVFFGMLIFLPLFELVGLAVVPWVADRRECFGVSVPGAAHGDRRVRRYTMMFSLAVGFFGVACVAVSLLLSQIYGRTIGFWALIATVFAQLGAGLALQQAFRRKVMVIKASNHWIVDSDRRAAILADSNMPKPISAAWNLLYLAPIAITLVMGYANYAAIPARVALHENAAGMVDGWAGKSHGLLWMAPGLQLLLAVVFTAAQLLIAVSKRPVDPDRPAETAYAYGLFARAWSIYMVSCGMVLVSVLGLTLQASVIGAASLDTVGAAALAAAVAVLAGAVVLAVFYGQNGSRVLGSSGSASSDSASASSSDDHFWKLGVFYANRNDSATIIPKRFGVGWTLNFARPNIWFAILVFALTVIGVPVLLALQ
ncbi:DUF1648 domain-containing protein [Bifidobacterium sp.]|jgi:uncharacterized membrane protein|uniref:DUF1648 domain-containing protein n=1 Tax=Bifidobacterium sp. TaxID=41200 RepID=UPI0025BAF850|nr:DUF5808 domain-containing protein [Bifidobacterium sp.]MCH4208690.1 DUF5808 domain-containing protein [Bifidobacterium sp.]MCI1224338.1 DUF5808 domain-containing protein [Bifidobacterium sp.]